MNTKSKHHFVFFLAMIICLFPAIVFAKKVDINIAKNVAINLYAERAGNTSPNISISRLIEEKENGTTTFYVIIYFEKGFALVSADDIVQPILGYSFESTYNENNHSPAFEFYILKRFRKQIYAAKQAKVTPDEETIQEWNKLSVSPTSFQPKSVKSIDPLLTTVWHQRWPYNAHCPVDSSSCNTCNNHVYVGCVATAMAQVLNYWHHPWHGTDYHSYTPESHPEYGVLEAFFENTYYNFDNMPDTATEYSEDLAELNYHCGVAVNMDYGPDGSGAWGWGSNNNDVSEALKNYFYFNNNVDDIVRSSHPITWVDKMKENLDADRPVIYGAKDNDADIGHAWVLDAYTSGDMFHCNWGWGGNDNGFFSIDNFGPVNGGYTFDVYEHACVKIYPKTGTLSGTLTLAGSPYTYNYDQYINSGSQLTIEPGVEVIFNGRYKLVVRGQLTAIGSPSGIIQFNAQVPEIGMQGVMFENLNDNSMDSSKLVKCHLQNGKGNWNAKTPIHDNRGGGVYCENSSKVLIDSRIDNCKAEYGGGIACFNNSGIKIHGCYIENDTAIMGGGIYLSNSDAILSENHISGNYTTYSSGGGVYCDNSDAVFFKDEIQNNTAHFVGGIACNSSNVTMDSVSINNNYADNYSGGLSAEMNSNLVLNGCQIYNNIGNEGGALKCDLNSSAEMNNVLVHNNSATTGSALYLTSNASVTLNNCTMAYNDESFGVSAGIYVQDTSTLTVNNSILWDNATDEIFKEDGSFVNASYSIVQNGSWGGPGLKSDYPNWSNYNLLWEDYPLPDGDKSPAIDAGDPTSPNDPDGTRADMGYKPYEQTYTSVPGGNISGTLTCANSPYYVNGDITIASGDELTIEPCVTVIFRGDYKLEVRGRLLAEGTDYDRITFAAADTIEGWQGIRFINTNINGQDSSKLIHCRVTFGNAYLGGAIYFANASDILIKNCLINKNYAGNAGGAIYINESLPKIINNTFSNNSAPSGGAIYFNWGNPIIQGGIIENNEAEYGGACYLNGSNPTFSGVTIRNNNAKFGGGIYMYGGCTPVFDPVNLCNIYMNYAYACGLDFCTTSWWGYPITINVDTFGVINPNNHFVYPEDIYTLNIQNGLIEQTSEDLYVSTTGSDENSGTNPAEPLKTMHMAMMKIMADETDTAVVFLAGGTYSEAMTGEMMPINWRGDVSLIGESVSSTIIYGEDKNQLMYCYADSNFFIREINFWGGYAEDGGGIYFDHYSNPSMSNIRIHHSYATGDGGGLFCNDHSSPQLDTVVISNNFAEGNGGGICLENNSDAVFRHVTISENSANYTGGGLQSRVYCDFIMDDVTITANAAAHGGGMVADFYSDPVISNSQITYNDAISYTGYPASGGGVRVTYGSNAVFENVDVFSNTSDYNGGGIDCSAGIQFQNGKITSNFAQQSGGGLYLNGGGNQKFINSGICDNTADDFRGAAIYASSPSPEFINVTISGNTAVNDYASLIYCHNSNPTFTNSILWDNTPALIDINSGSVTAEYSNIEDSWPGTGNINTDPLFTNASASGYSLQETSPCINAGTPDTTGLNLPLYDLAGNPRITNGIIDMGAYEYLPIGNTIELDLRVFLEGPFNGTDMNTTLVDIPLSQSYNTTPWNYTGVENVISVPSGVVDWVLVELRDAPDPASAFPSTMIARRAGFLLNDGSVVDLDGSSYLTFNGLSVENSLYVIIWHRNHLGIMSGTGLTGGGIVSLDFTISEATVYNSSLGAYKELASGVWGMVGGDANADGHINDTDKTLWTNNVGTKGYKATDHNMDSEVNNQDKNDTWAKNGPYFSQVPE